jgi:Cu-Zn family superoxide dismutase
MPIKNIVTALAACALFTLTSVGLWAQGQHEMAAPITKAIAVMYPTKGSEVKGTVTFTKTSSGIRVQADISGLKPGKHGFHIHEFGDPSSPDAKSAGGHFNPYNMPHSGPMSTKRHVGDLGNIEADSSGHATYDLIDPALGFQGPGSILGRGLIIHEKADDLTTQPTGDAGGRVAVGIIGVTKGS